MANKTDSRARNVRGTDPQNLIETILRSKIQNSTYWLEECFGLDAETILDKALELPAIGGTYGGTYGRPTKFISLVLKLLQIQPDTEVVLEYIKNDEFKYLRALGAFYFRLVGVSVDVYRALEPLYTDYRKLRMIQPDGKCVLIHMDEYIEMLLTSNYVFNITLPRLTARTVLETTNALAPRESLLNDLLDAPKAPSPDSRPAAAKRERSESPQASGSDSNDSGGPDRSRRKRRRREGGESDDERKSRRRKPADRLFKGSKSGRHGSAGRGTGSGGDGAASAEQTEIDEWNKVRAELGLPPLKP